MHLTVAKPKGNTFARFLPGSAGGTLICVGTDRNRVRDACILGEWKATEAEMQTLADPADATCLFFGMVIVLLWPSPVSDLLL